MSYPALPTPDITVQMDDYSPQATLPVAAMHKIHRTLGLSRTQRYTFEVFLREALHYTLRPGRRRTDVNGDAEVQVRVFVDRFEVTVRSDRQGPGSPLANQKNLLFGLMDRVEVRTTEHGKELRAVKFLYRRSRYLDPAKVEMRGGAPRTRPPKKNAVDANQDPVKRRSVRLSTN